MALVKVYDPQGKEYEKEPVDARECVKHMGWTMEQPDDETIVPVNEATEPGIKRVRGKK